MILLQPPRFCYPQRGDRDAWEGFVMDQFGIHTYLQHCESSQLSVPSARPLYGSPDHARLHQAQRFCEPHRIDRQTVGKRWRS